MLELQKINPSWVVSTSKGLKRRPSHGSSIRV